jgi:glycosyltransferase involved in cell wall biosynthesis
VGDGPLRAEVQRLLAASGATDLAWLPGEREDVPDVMRSLDAFVLPSLAEGISNAILEAMSSALPVLATRVGGNAELVAEGSTGTLVQAGDAQALAQALVAMAQDPARAKTQGLAGRQRVLERFSLAAMVSAYRVVYDQQLARRGPGRAVA